MIRPEVTWPMWLTELQNPRTNFLCPANVWKCSKTVGIHVSSVVRERVCKEAYQ